MKGFTGKLRAIIQNQGCNNMEENHQIYLDYAATTPLDSRVLKKMLPYFAHEFGNPSSVHSWGQKAEAVVENAREQITKLLKADQYQIVFTSGGTEGDNLAVKGAARGIKNITGKNHLLISPVEHPAVARSAEHLDKEGFTLEWLEVDSYGMVDPEVVAGKIRTNTALVSVVYGQNEIGTINPIDEIARVCREREVFFHTDAVQAAAHLQIDLEKASPASMAIGAHKFYGPKGIGALLVRKGSKLDKLQNGGGQEFRMRAGTHNVPGIVGLAAAIEITHKELRNDNVHEQQLRDRLIAGITGSIQNAKLTGHPSQRLSNHASFVFDGCDGNTLLMILDAAGFACSSGSACKSGNPKPSDVLLAIGIEPKQALGSLRVTVGRHTQEEEIEAFLQYLPQAVNSARKLSS